MGLPAALLVGMLLLEGPSRAVADGPFRLPLPPFPSGPAEPEEPPEDPTTGGLPPLPPTMAFPPSREPSMIKRAFERFPDERSDEVMAFIEAHLPREMHRFRRLSRQHFQNAVDFLTDLVQESLDLIHMKETRPGLFEKIMARRRLEERVLELSELCRRTKGAEAARHRQELRKAVETGFDLRQEIMRQEVKDMRGELKELEELIGKRDANRELIIDRKFSELTGKAPGLSW
jgi:hypothetical protein